MKMNISLQIAPGSAGVIVEHGTLKNVLHTIRYRVCGFDGVSFAYRNGELVLSMPNNEDSFLPYSQLTEDLVISWIEAQDSDTLQTYEQEIIQELADRASSLSIVEMVLPWESRLGG